MSSSPNTNDKVAVIKWLPWVLLLIAIAAAVWLFTSMRAPSEAKWEKPVTPATEQPIIAPTTDGTAPITSYHDAVARASQSVVNIYTTQVMEVHPYMEDPILRRFFEFHGSPDSQGATNLGSGVIVSPDGYIVTNAHVIEKSDEITVAFNDGRKSRARIVGTDPDSDLAVIKVEMTDLTPLAFREAPSRVGDIALAIGNPFGVGQTVTQGIISAT